jgi:hypothetical protein
MRKIWINGLCLAVLLAAAAAAAAQPGPDNPFGQPKQGKSDPSRPADPNDPKGEKPKDEKKAPAKSKLEEMLEEALQYNPDIRVADAKTREAEAELNRTRLAVTQKVVALSAALDAARANVAANERRIERVKDLRTKGGISAEEFEAAAALLQQAKADLAKLEAETPYVTGRPPKEPGTDEAVRRGLRYLYMTQLREARTAEDAELRFRAVMDLVERGAAEEKPGAERIRGALVKPVSVRFQKRPLPEILLQLSDIAPDVPIQVKGDPSWEKCESVAAANFKDAPLAVVLEWFEDSLPKHRAYVRDYGVLFLSDDMRPPAGAVPLRFWKAAKQEAKEGAEKK